MHVYEMLAEPIRRRIVEILASGPHASGDIVNAVTHEFGVSRAAVAHHLKVLRDHDAVRVDWDWPYKVYELDPYLFRQLGIHYNRMLYFWRRRLGGRKPADQLKVHRIPDSRRGIRGRGIDPDWPRIQQLRTPD